MSPESAGLAVKMGYSNVKVYLQGNIGWVDIGRALVASDAFVLGGNLILIDLRSPEDAKKAHIPRAVNIPFAQLEESIDQFPRYAAAPIVFYGDDEEVRAAINRMRDVGYRIVSAVEGGIARWMASGRPITAGAPATQVVWQRKLGEGEITLAEFQKVMADPSADKVILDVRGTGEFAEGHLSGAVNIPLDQLDSRLGELPTGKEVLIHCSTGARAEMARATLVKAGINARFLMANFECENGKCTLEE